MDYKEIRKQYIKSVLKYLLDDWLDTFFIIEFVLLIFHLTIAFVLYLIK